MLKIIYSLKSIVITLEIQRAKKNPTFILLIVGATREKCLYRHHTRCHSCAREQLACTHVPGPRVLTSPGYSLTSPRWPEGSYHERMCPMETDLGFPPTPPELVVEHLQAHCCNRLSGRRVTEELNNINVQ